MEQFIHYWTAGDFPMLFLLPVLIFGLCIMEDIARETIKFITHKNKAASIS